MFDRLWCVRLTDGRYYGPTVGVSATHAGAELLTRADAVALSHHYGGTVERPSWWYDFDDYLAARAERGECA